MRRITLRVRPDSTAVTECGYMNNARAEPNASVPYAQYVELFGMKTPVASPDLVGVFIFVSAALKIPWKPIFTPR